MDFSNQVLTSSSIDFFYHVLYSSFVLCVLIILSYFLVGVVAIVAHFFLGVILYTLRETKIKLLTKS